MPLTTIMMLDSFLSCKCHKYNKHTELTLYIYVYFIVVKYFDSINK